MDNQLADLAASIAHSKDDSDAWRAGKSYFEALGFETVNYGIMDRKNDSFLGFYTNMDPDWMSYYADCRYDEVDPLIKHCMKYSHPIDYSYKSESQLELVGSDEEAKMLNDCYEAGIHNSFLVPFHNDMFPLAGGINLAGRMSAKNCRSLVAENRNEIMIAGALLNSYLAGMPQGMERSKYWQKFHDNDSDITPREVEVLKWLSTGLRNDRVAERMKVSPVTINFHMGSIKKKLSARTREQALVIALRKGIVTF